MRAGLLEQLPALTLEFGIVPSDIDGRPGMTADEINWYLTVADRRQKQRVEDQRRLEQQARKARRGR